MKATGSLSLADLIQAFFRRHLIATRGVSPHTLHAYRDAIRGLLTFAAARCSRSVVELSVGDLGRDTVLGFLDHLEQQRGNTAATRNARLAAIHSLQRFIAVEDPSALAICQQVLSIPYKRTPSRAVTCLARGARSPRCCPFAVLVQHRRTRSGSGRSQASGRPLRSASPGAATGQRSEGALVSTLDRDSQSVACDAPGSRDPAHRGCPSLCQCDRTPADAFRLRAHRTNARRGCINLPTAAGQSANHPAHLPSHNRLALAAIGSGTQRRAQLAWTRQHRDHSRLYRDRSGDEACRD
jgi:hypothetical protein